MTLSDGEAVPEMPPVEAFADFERRVARDFPDFVSKFGALFLDHLDDPAPEHEWLIEGFLSAGDRSVIGGPSQSGKSFLAIHAGMCIAFGVDFFTAKVKPGLVIYQAGEGAKGVKKRLRAWRRHHDVQFTRETRFVLLQSPIDLYHPEGDTQKLIDEIEAIEKQFDVPLRLVVIDTLATATGGADENSGKDMGIVMQNIARINSRTGAHVCLVHHMNAGGTKLRGHTSIYANIDQVMLVTRNETTKVRTAVIDKQKDDESGAKFQFELMSIELGTDASDRPITSCVCLPVGEKEAIRRNEEQKGLRLTDQEIIFMRALFEADRRHGRPVPSDMENVPPSVRSIVSYEDVKRAYVAANPSDAVQAEGATEEELTVAQERHRETLRKRLQRVREYLTGAQVIGTAGTPTNGVIWWTGKPLRAFPHTLPKVEVPEVPEGFPDSSQIPF